MKTIEFKRTPVTQHAIDLKESELINRSGKRMTLNGRNGCLIIEAKSRKKIKMRVNTIFHEGTYFYCQEAYEFIIGNWVMMDRIDPETIRLKIR
ncbi:MAG: hypothetical protein AAGA66_09300 [Bacteroidota bacterium]